MTNSSKIVPVILSGGSGTRLWPISRNSFPKQLQALTSDLSLLQDTLGRVAGNNRFAAPVIVCNEEHRFVVAEQARQADAVPSAIVLEPAGRNTAPAAAVAALLLAAEDADRLMLVLPSDHAVADKDGFIAAITSGAKAAQDGALVTFGISPTRPETGYGYIRCGAASGENEGCFAVAEFIEKPDAAKAERFLSEGGYVWNSGMFLFSAAAYLDELERLEPDMIAHCREAISTAVHDFDFLRLVETSFGAAPSKSIDYAVMEHTENAVVVPAEMGWSDVGSWSALWEIGTKDKDGNVAMGDVCTLATKGSYLHGQGQLVAAVGVEDMIIVATGDAVLVAPKSHAEDVKQLVDALKEGERTEAGFHPRVYRPWGYYQTVHSGERFQVKRITVDPGASLSLQLHHRRAEHWVVTNGTAAITRGDDVFTLNANESTYIPPETRHRLENAGAEPLNLIEVQSGEYLGEDDIVRLDDNYGRD